MSSALKGDEPRACDRKGCGGEGKHSPVVRLWPKGQVGGAPIEAALGEIALCDHCAMQSRWGDFFSKKGRRDFEAKCGPKVRIDWSLTQLAWTKAMA